MKAASRAIGFVLMALLVVAAPASVYAQSALLQGGPITAGHVPMYINSYSQQPVVVDSGPASGGPLGTGLGELGITSRGNGTGPFASTGSGAYGAPFCINDGPTTSPSGYHSLCLSPNSTGYGGVVSYTANGGAAQLPLTFIQNGTPITFPFTPFGAPLSTVVSGGLNPLPIGSPLYNWGVGFPTSNGANVADPGGFYIGNGSVNVYKDRAYGTEDRSCAGSFVLNGLPSSVNNMHCGSDGGITETPSNQALYTGFDTVALFSSNSAKAPLSTDPAGTFDSLHYYPSAGYVLTSAQVAQLRVGMAIRVGLLTAGTGASWNGLITGWASNGTSITVSGWYASGNTASGQTPNNNTVTYVSPQTGVFATNFATEWNPSLNPLATDALGGEVDVYNDSGVASTVSNPAGKGWLVSCASNVTPEPCGFANYVIGTWVAGVYVKDTTFGAFVYAPSSVATGTAFYSGQQLGNLLVENNPALGQTVLISSAGNAVLAGNVAALTMSTTAGYQMYGTGGQAFEAGTVSGTNNVTISPNGTAIFAGLVQMGAATISGNVSGVNVLTAAAGEFSAMLTAPVGTAPSGTCAVAGQMEGDATKLYWCPSAGGVWKYAALTTN